MPGLSSCCPVLWPASGQRLASRWHLQPAFLSPAPPALAIRRPVLRSCAWLRLYIPPAPAPVSLPVCPRVQLPVQPPPVPSQLWLPSTAHPRVSGSALFSGRPPPRPRAPGWSLPRVPSLPRSGQPPPPVASSLRCASPVAPRPCGPRLRSAPRGPCSPLTPTAQTRTSTPEAPTRAPPTFRPRPPFPPPEPQRPAWLALAPGSAAPPPRPTAPALPS